MKGNEKIKGLFQKAQKYEQYLRDTGGILVGDTVIDKFSTEVQRTRRDIEADEESDERNLRIGIVGEMKAGKSSFLNSLLFGGKDILPKAPTPMTAVLTIIGYAKQAHAEICYYNNKDWEVITKQETEYQNTLDKLYDEAKKAWNQQPSGIEFGTQLGVEEPTRESVEIQNQDVFSDSQRSGHELYKQVKDNNLQESDYLEKKISLQGADVMVQLDEYIGSKGKYTPLVKKVSVYLADEKLKGFEIIDTPGLNDPVVSRSYETKENLRRCDVVFLLSRCSQFFTADDLKFLKSDGVAADIKKAFLVGTQLDSAVLQCSPRKKVSIRKAYSRTIENCKKHVRDVLQKQISGENVPAILRELSKNDILFTSSYMDKAQRGLADGTLIDEGLLQTLGNMEKHFTDFKYDKDHEGALVNISGFTKIHDKILFPLRQEKDKIIQEKLAGRCDTAVTNFVNVLEEINRCSKINLRNLESEDVERLQEKITNIKCGLDAARAETQHAFNRGGNEAQSNLFGTIASISEALKRHTELTISYREEVYTYETGIVFKDKHHYTENVPYVTVAEVEQNAHAYAAEIAEIANRDFRTIFDVEAIKHEVKEAILKVFEHNQKDFNIDNIVFALDDCLGELKLTPMEMLDIKRYDMILYEKVDANSYENSNRIAELRRIQMEVLMEVEQEGKDILFKKSKEMEHLMKKNAGMFVDLVSEAVEKNQVLMQKQMQDKEKFVAKHKQFQIDLTAIKKDFLSLLK